MLPVFLLCIALFEIAGLLNTVIIICAGFVSVVFAKVVSVVSTVAIYSLCAIVATQIIFWIPSMIVLGYPLKSALIFSMNAISGKTSYAFKHFALCFVISALISGFTYVFLSAYIFSLSMFVTFIIYLLLFMFVISYSMVAFFDVAEETRNDLKKKKSYMT